MGIFFERRHFTLKTETIKEKSKIEQKIRFLSRAAILSWYPGRILQDARTGYQDRTNFKKSSCPAPGQDTPRPGDQDRTGQSFRPAVQKQALE